MIDCQKLTFSPKLSTERIVKAEGLFGKTVLRKILCFALYLLGVNRTAIAQATGISRDSVKTILRVLHRDGLLALEDRRRASSAFLAPQDKKLKIDIREEPDFLIIEFGENECVKIRRNNTVQIKTFVLSLVNAGLIAAKAASDILHLTSSYVQNLAKQLEQKDVDAVLLDKRQGQMQQYRMTTETTALLIQQFAAHTISGKSTSSIVLADELNVPDRTIRMYAHKLGFSKIVNSLPELVNTLKKNS